MRKMKYRVIVETDFRNRPKEHELSAAILIANHYFVSHRSKIRHLIVITKSEEILEMF